MQTAVASDYQGYSYDRDETERTLRAISEAGITHVHWCHGWDGAHLYTKGEIDFICSALAEYDLKLKGIHGTNGWYYRHTEGQYKWYPQADDQISYTSFNETLRKGGADLIRNRLELAKAAGTREVVLHMQLPYVHFDDRDYRERYYAQAYKSLDEVQDYAQINSIRICVENLVGTPDIWQFEQFDRLFERYPAEFLGYCCDIGHATLTNPVDPLDLPRRYRNRMYMIHLNENHSFPRPGDFSDDCFMSDCDEHLVMGEGCVDFEHFADILADSPYEMPLVGEFAMHEGETEKEFLKKSRERLEAYTLLVEEKRKALSMKL